MLNSPTYGNPMLVGGGNPTPKTASVGLNSIETLEYPLQDPFKEFRL